ncbi:hypothetical protein QN277_010039 [Acacia crassicarpa]|uniref:Uncharacterized protein n=1 Tax=Acacia crassicarpa TaxID=499986 RepID=A0AAE1MCH2_9FABA|nr:hypothetical protein QN277_010039 [Acacia crassicarpa]
MDTTPRIKWDNDRGS